jgi:hypothetical protein
MHNNKYVLFPSSEGDIKEGGGSVFKEIYHRRMTLWQRLEAFLSYIYLDVRLFRFLATSSNGGPRH